MTVLVLFCLMVSASPGGAPPPGNTSVLAAPVTPATDRYLRAVGQKIRPHWEGVFLMHCQRLLKPEHPLSNLRLEALLRLAINPDGSFAAAEVVNPSGVADFDSSSVDVLKAAGPFPEPPTQIISDDGLTYVEWPFARDPMRRPLEDARMVHIAWPLARAIPARLAAGQVDLAVARLLQVASDPKTPESPETILELSRDVARAIIRQGLGLDESVQRDAARAAGHARVQTLVEPLRGLASKGSGSVKGAALGALGRLGDQPSLETARAALATLDPTVGVGAGQAMAELGRGADAWSILSTRILEPKALEIAAHLGLQQSVRALAEILRDATAGTARRVRAAQGLGIAAQGRSGSASRALRGGLGDGNPKIRAAAANALTRAGRDGLRSKSLFYRVLPLTTSGPVKTRAAALAAASYLGGAPAGPHILLVAGKARSNNTTLLIGVAEALAPIGSKAALERLLFLVSHPDPGVRIAALRALARRDEPEARDKLVKAVDGGCFGEIEPDLARELTVGLFRHRVETEGPKATVAEFARWSRSDDPRTRVAIAEAWLQGTRQAGAPTGQP